MVDLPVYKQWSYKDENGVIVIPYSYAPNYAKPNELKNFMATLSSELEPCIRLEYHEHPKQSGYENGLYFVWEDPNFT